MNHFFPIFSDCLINIRQFDLTYVGWWIQFIASLWNSSFSRACYIRHSLIISLIVVSDLISLNLWIHLVILRRIILLIGCVINIGLSLTLYKSLILVLSKLMILITTLSAISCIIVGNSNFFWLTNFHYSLLSISTFSWGLWKVLSILMIFLVDDSIEFFVESIKFLS